MKRLNVSVTSSKSHPFSSQWTSWDNPLMKVKSSRQERWRCGLRDPLCIRIHQRDWSLTADENERAQISCQGTARTLKTALQFMHGQNNTKLTGKLPRWESLNSNYTREKCWKDSVTQEHKQPRQQTNPEPHLTPSSSEPTLEPQNNYINTYHLCSHLLSIAHTLATFLSWSN